jgi:hypothetical protein
LCRYGHVMSCHCCRPAETRCVTSTMAPAPHLFDTSSHNNSQRLSRTMSRSLCLLTLLLLQPSAAFVAVPPPQARLEQPRLARLAVAAVDRETSSSTTGSVEFPPPLSTLGRIQRAATFWSTAIPIVAQYYGLISKIKLQEILGNPMAADQVEQLWNSQHEAGATRLADVITDLKGFYVKTAQIISSRQDLFPSQ